MDDAPKSVADVAAAMPTEKGDSKKILGDDFTFNNWDDNVLCTEDKCGYKTPVFPECCGFVNDSEGAFCWPFIVNTGCRNVGGAKCKKCETCVRSGGFSLCCAQACEFPPGDKVPLGCGCCGAKIMGDMENTLTGTGLTWNDDTMLKSQCICQQCALFSKFPACCGMHSSGECLFMTFILHAALDPIETLSKGRTQQCCQDQMTTNCPKPCWPFCMYKDDALCC